MPVDKLGLCRAMNGIHIMKSRMNQQVVLASRPHGLPVQENFRLVETELREINDGEFLIQNLYLSMDAGFRHWMNEGSSDNYLPEMPIDAPVTSLTLGKVVASKNADFEVGQLYLGRLAWEQYSISDGNDFLSLIANDLDMSLNHYLGVLGSTGFTAYFGMLDIGQPQAGEVVLISAAAGAVGAIAGQIAKLHGAFVIGLTSSDEKCRRLEQDFGYDRVINYKTTDVDSALQDICPEGIDIYFDNVGGAILETALDHIRENARIIMCGAVASYNATEAIAGPANIFQLTTKRALMKGFMYTDHMDRYEEATAAMTAWLEQGEIKNAEYVLSGIEDAGKAFCHMFEGKNLGKTLVKLDQQ